MQQAMTSNLERKPSGLQLSRWFDRAVDAYDEKGNPMFLDAEGKLKVGIYRNLPNDVYHELPALSSSGLKKFSDCPAKYEAQYIQKRNRRKTTGSQRSLDTGSLVHELILETPKFYESYCREPLLTDPEFVDRNMLITSDDLKAALADKGLKVSGKKQDLIERLLADDPNAPIWEHIREQILLQNGEKSTSIIEGVERTTYGGKLPIDGVMWDDAIRCYTKMQKHQDASQTFVNGESEIAFIALCPFTGEFLKCKFDWLRYDDHAADLKTAKSVKPRAFISDIFKYRYDLQLAFYRYVASCLDVTIREFPLVAVEYAEADIVQPFTPCQSTINKAEEDMFDLLEEFKRCKETMYWPGYIKTDEVIVFSRSSRH